MSVGCMRVGMAKTEITPPAGLPLSGYSQRSGVSSGVANPLYARALSVFNTTEKRRIVFLVCDLLALDLSVLRKFRKQLEVGGFDSDSVIVAATHTHSGPAYGQFFDLFCLSSGGEESPASKNWSATLIEKMVNVVGRALESERDAGLAFATTTADLSVNRRLIDPFGEVRLAPSPAGVTDPQVSVLCAKDRITGEVLATLVNYACHPVVLCEDNLRYSGDYPYFAVESLERKTGAPALFINGACGNLNPQERGDYETAQRIGEALADKAFEAVQNITSVSEKVLPLTTRSFQVGVPPSRLPSKESLEHYKNVTKQRIDSHGDLNNYEGQRLKSEAQRAEAMFRLTELRREWIDALTDPKTPSINALVQVAAIGPAAFVALPGEFFCEIGLEIKRKSPFKFTFIAGYSNNLVGYVPTEKARSLGGYEIRTTLVGEGAAQIFIENALEALRMIG